VQHLGATEIAAAFPQPAYDRVRMPEGRLLAIL